MAFAAYSSASATRPTRSPQSLRTLSGQEMAASAFSIRYQSRHACLRLGV